MLEINLNMYHGVALGAAMFWLGTVLTRKIGVLSRFCIPAPLVGGLCFALVNALLYAAGVAVIQFDNTLETVFMVLFFCTVGFTVSIPQLARGGRAVILLLVLGIVMIVVQNGMGGAIMALMGKNPLYGIGCGSIALIGGPGTAAGIGPDLEAAGAAGAKAVSVAAATFGLVSGSLMGGPTARRLINKYNLKSKGGGEEAVVESEQLTTDSGRLIKGFMIILVGVGVGNQVSTWLTRLCGFSFPGYIGAMVVAVVIRNVMDAGKMEFPAGEIDAFGNVFLSIFLSMALAGLKLWQLVDLALPMIACLAMQVVVMFIFSYFIVFRVMGRDYDAAVMTAGFVGFAMGATSNAMANMQAVTKKYGPSPIAYFAIPMVGSLFIDFFNAAMIAFNIGLWS
ncbi:MAG: sodium:glutamate symporter [Oscillospiraceae bacterium]|nr:sodium:glutamate symporter [Oscillospiraceae bacterium]